MKGGHRPASLGPPIHPCSRRSSFQPTKALSTLDHLRTIGKQINDRLLETERLSHACSLEPSGFEQLQQPIVLGDRGVSALRFGDPRVHALLQTISRFSLVLEGFQNRDLRPLVAALLGRELDRTPAAR